MNLVISAVVLVIVVVLNLVEAQPQKFTPIPNAGRPVLAAFLLLCAYSFILSFSLGYLSNESEFILANTGALSSVLNVILYIGNNNTRIQPPMRKFHMGIITYVANAVMIIAIAYVNFFNSQTALSGGQRDAVFCSCDQPSALYFLIQTWSSARKQKTLPLRSARDCWFLFWEALSETMSVK